MPIADRRTRVLLTVSAVASAVALGLTVLDLALMDGVAATLADVGLGSRSALLALGTVALPGMLVLGWLFGPAGRPAVRSAPVAPAPSERDAVGSARILLRQQARHHTGTILALRL